MANQTHPFDPEMLYELTDDGHIRVSGRGKSGVFTTEGQHVSGDLREADPQLCVWVGNNFDPAGTLSRSRMAGRDKT